MTRLVLATTALCALLLSGLVTALVCAQDGSVVPADSSAKQIEKDLRIEAELLCTTPVQLGTPVRIGAKLVNGSRTAPHLVVAPGDGSGSGWREPHVFYSGQKLADDGTWADLEPRGIGRCGMYDENWHDEVSELSPGESLHLQPWSALPSMVFDLSRPGTFRLRLHYRYAGGKLGRGPDQKADPGPMKGVPPFELVSEPVTFVIERGLELELRALRGMPRNETIRLSELLDARLVNRSDRKRDVIRSDWEATLRTSPHGALPSYQDPVLTFVRQPDPTTLAPGESLPLFGTGFDTEFRYSGAEPFSVHLQLRSRGDDGTLLHADPVEIRVGD